ncbi:MAG: hypothetical protein D6B25_07055 [Desulfobulbaceae bacterium]|nr:MAG: hypothetical protein D6B25_07055 [Desulfobulbaceae bacterium]
MWRACIKKVWEVDPLTWPKCAGEMKIVSFIYQHKVIRKILEHLKLYSPAEAGRAPIVSQGKQRAPPLKNKGSGKLSRCRMMMAGRVGKSLFFEM